MRFQSVAMLAGLWLALVAGTGPAHAQAKPPPAEAFFDRGSVQSMRLSPSGRYLAAEVLPAGGKSIQLVVSDLDDKEPDKVVATFARADVKNTRWVSDDFLVFSVTDHLTRETYQYGPDLVAVRRNGDDMRRLIAADNFSQATKGLPLSGYHQYLALGKAGSDEIIVGEWQYGADDMPRSLYPLVLNLRTGARRSAAPDAPADVVGWVFDHRGQPRVGYSRKDGQAAWHWFDLKTKAWREIARFEYLSMPFVPVWVDADDRLYVQVALPGGVGDELRRFDFATGKPEADALLATPGFSDNIGGIIDRESGEMMGLNVLTDARQTVWLTPALQALQAKVDAALPGRVNRLLCERCDRQERVLVYSYNDRSPGEYLLHKVKSNEWQRLGPLRPKIDPQAMASTQFHRIKARDGADLPVWVTLPAGSDKPRAAVVLAHGGPWVRGAEWAWDAEAQFLASRGYVVIEPEFRGSTGYGDRHYRDGFRQWGQAMQDDVSDALRFAVKKGWVDASRVCIAGGSYGGYATLMGLAKDPEQYRCGVAWIAVSDPRLMFSIHWSDISNDAKRYTMKEMIGDPVADAAMLAANAPLEQAARIRAPVLLAYGGRDRRVPIEHGERMRAALTKAGKPPEWVVYPDEGHGFADSANRIDFWKRVEAFLAKQLAP